MSLDNESVCPQENGTSERTRPVRQRVLSYRAASPRHCVTVLMNTRRRCGPYVSPHRTSVAAHTHCLGCGGVSALSAKLGGQASVSDRCGTNGECFRFGSECAELLSDTRSWSRSATRDAACTVSRSVRSAQMPCLDEQVFGQDLTGG